ncbi:MAG: hypothetical protein KDC57_12765 [Saprospiraceae bacterium]|nr:hypothetical protein [Saprospiraceae bacterium]
MTRWLILISLFCTGLSIRAQTTVRTGLTLTTDHFPQPEVPRGVLKGPFEFHSSIITGTVRQYWIYVPAQYEDAQEAAVLVFQDGFRATNPNGSIRAPQVLDNLIAQGDLPVTIGIFISPGNRSETYPDNLGSGNPDHRAEEYDAMDDRYTRFIVEEMLPLVGKSYRLTNDPDQRAIGGTSSGAIAAFTVAWHRPDVFHKVFSGIGSYVSIGFRPDEDPVKLGGQDYPALIRRENIRPIRIFLQDGTNDLDNEWGNWYLANQQMLAALNYANRIADEKGITGPRYQIKTVWTDGRHSDHDPGALLPEGLRWLWYEKK